ncbi:MAG: NADH:ubiquinone reductase (Na(+)-transporting) subunit A, partial [Candidatus Neomarinimicrobiota bacterium]
MATIKIKKGHNIQITGRPGNELAPGLPLTAVGLNPHEFRGIKPKLLVKIGDRVQIGSPLFFDKLQPSIKWPSPAGGTIKQIQFGPRRIIEKIVITRDEEESTLKYESFKSFEISSLGREKILEIIIKGNLWPLIRQRPFNKLANPMDKPRDIFISGWNTAPLSVNLDLALRGKLVQFQAGIDVLKQLTEGKVHLSIEENTVSETFMNVKGVEINRFTGPHPAGNVGIQIHHINPLRPREIVWVIEAQHITTLGQFFLSGEYNPALIVSVGGPGVIKPTYIQARIGVCLGDLLKNNIKIGSQRIISGDVLTGMRSSMTGHLGFYDSIISVLPEGGVREFLGMLKPGSSQTRYSLTNAFLKFKNNLFSFNTLNNGAERAMVPLNAWENVLPM